MIEKLPRLNCPNCSNGRVLIHTDDYLGSQGWTNKPGSLFDNCNKCGGTGVSKEIDWRVAYINLKKQTKELT